jgi:glycine/D-amino acid oxidase-like deaminating enzyme
MVHSHDALLIGRGIAGAALAETLRQRGLRVHIYDRKRPGNASMAAAGVVNPVVLKRDVPSWRAGELLPKAERFYTHLEGTLGASFWHPVELVKLFASERDALQWEQAQADPLTGTFMDRRPQPEVDAAPVHAAHGHGTVHRAAWLDVPAMLEAQRRVLLDEAVLSEEDIPEAAIQHMPDGVCIGERSAPWLVRCAGPFAALGGLVPVKGEGLNVRMPGLPRHRMLHRGVFALPAPGGLHRVGATFAWEQVWDGPTDEARNWLLEKLGKLTPVVPEVVDHWTGVRPTSHDRRPILGRVAAHEAVLNGLGARGVLLAPWCAAHLADHLFGGKALEPEVDVARFTRPA